MRLVSETEVFAQAERDHELGQARDEAGDARRRHGFGARNAR